MKTTLKHMALTGALLLSPLALAQAGEPPARAPRAGAAEGKPVVTVDINFDEKGLLERLHELHQREIAWGKLARDTASMASTRELAEAVVREHETADQRVIQVADQRKLKLGKPDYTGREKRARALNDATEAMLKESQGPAFDSVYLSHQVMEHDRAIQFFTAAQSRFGGPEMTPVLGQVIPRLVSHREQAYRALGDIPSARAMGGSGPDTGMGTGGSSGKRREGGK